MSLKQSGCFLHGREDRTRIIISNSYEASVIIESSNTYYTTLMNGLRVNILRKPGHVD